MCITDILRFLPPIILSAFCNTFRIESVLEKNILTLEPICQSKNGDFDVLT